MPSKLLGEAHTEAREKMVSGRYHRSTVRNMSSPMSR